MTLSTKYGRYDGWNLVTNSGAILNLHGIFNPEFQIEGNMAADIRRYLMNKKDQLALDKITFKPNGLDLLMSVHYDTGRVETYSLQELVMRAITNAHADKNGPEEMELDAFYPPIPDLKSTNIFRYVADLLKL